MSILRRQCLFLAAFVVLSFSAVNAHAQQDESFMPKGGKTLLLDLFGEQDFSALSDFIRSRRTEIEWRGDVEKRGKNLSQNERDELVAYLSINLPLPSEVSEKAATRQAVKAALPPDGRELAWNQCQSCHSLYSGYLMHDRDAQAWRNLFLSPFHRRMKMTEAERETFARYSAINMPMKSEDVPSDLRY